MNDLPLVSVGIPTYNRPGGLRNVLNAVLNQTYSNLEIIVSDNCSADPQVQAVLKEFELADKRLKTFRQEKNIGLANNFQFVLDQAKGAFFLWVSDDDSIEANYVESTCNELIQSPDCNMVMGRMALYTPENEFIGYVEETTSIELDSPSKRVYKYYENLRTAGYFYGLYRTCVLTQVGYTNKLFGADILVSVYTMFSGKVKVTNDTAYRYIAGGNSVDHEKLARVIGLSQLNAIFFGFHDAWVLVGFIMKLKVFKEYPFFERLLFAFKCFWLELKYSKAFFSSYIVIKRKILRKTLGRQTLRRVQ